MKARLTILVLAAGLALAGIAAGVSASTIRYAGPVEVRVKETLSGTEYYTTGRYTTIPAALAAITDAAANKPYVIFLPPGVYDLGSTQISLKPFVAIVGSGEAFTTITCACGSVTPPLSDGSSATLLGADNAELRDLTVVNSGGNDYATAIHSTNGSPKFTMTRVRASASGSTNNYGIYNLSSSPTMTNVSANASGGTISVGVFNSNTSLPTMTNISASASGGADSFGVLNQFSSPAMTDITADATGGTANFGIENLNTSSPTMTNISASASGGTTNYGIENVTTSSPTMTNISASASGGTTNYGVSNTNSSSPTMTNVSASASGAPISDNIGVYNYSSSSPSMTDVIASASGGANSQNYGVRNFDSFPTMTDVTASASGGAVNYGMYNEDQAAGTLIINRSSFSGATNSIYSDTAYTVKIGASLLDGAISKGGGTWTCAETYNGSYVAYDGTCSAAGSLLPPADSQPPEPPPLPEPLPSGGGS